MKQRSIATSLPAKEGRSFSTLTVSIILITDVNGINPSAAFSYSVTFALPLLEEAVVGRTLAARINAFKTTAWCLHVDGAATAVVENGKRRSRSSGIA